MSQEALAVEELWEALSPQDVVAALDDASADRRVRATLARIAEPFAMFPRARRSRQP